MSRTRFPDFSPPPGHPLNMASSPGHRGVQQSGWLGGSASKSCSPPLNSPIAFSTHLALKTCGRRAPDIFFLAVHLSGEWLSVKDLLARTPYSENTLTKLLALGLTQGYFERKPDPTPRCGKSLVWHFCGKWGAKFEGSNSFSITNTKRALSTQDTQEEGNYDYLLLEERLSSSRSSPPDPLSNFPEARMKRCPKPKPPLPEPALELADRVFAFESLWTDACRTAFGNGYWRSLFTTRAPWRDSSSKQQRRWKAICKILVQLDTHSIDPKEYVAALITFYKDRKASGKTLLTNPNVGQCGGPWALQIWQEWRRKRLAEGYESEGRVRGAALLATQHPEEALKAEIRQAYQECISQGPDMAPSSSWGIEILWLFHQTESATRPFINQILQYERTENPERYALGMKRYQILKVDTGRQQRLLRLKQEAIFGLPPIPTAEEWMVAHPPPSQFPQNSILGKRGQA